MKLKHFNFNALRKCKLVPLSENGLISFQRIWLLQDASRETDMAFIYEKRENFNTFSEQVLSSLNDEFNHYLLELVSELKLFNRCCNFLMPFEIDYIERVTLKKMSIIESDFLTNYEITL